jgi:3'-5' exonuclease
MIEEIKLENILFLDIETVPISQTYSELPENMVKFWNKKADSLTNKTQSPEEVFQRAGIYAEFGKVVCISVGIIHIAQNIKHFRLKSFYGEDEKMVLQLFVDLLNKSYNNDKFYLCAHNGKEFDFPYISRRCLINGIKLPLLLNIAGKKPWEIKHLDTLELWKFGDYKHYTSLNLLTEIFNIPSPKDDIDGSQVAAVFYKEKDLPRIARYCQKDVVAIAQLFLRFRCEELIDESNISVVE